VHTRGAHAIAFGVASPFAGSFTYCVRGFVDPDVRPMAGLDDTTIVNKVYVSLEISSERQRSERMRKAKEQSGLS
jgi:hypothetical protein